MAQQQTTDQAVAILEQFNAFLKKTGGKVAGRVRCRPEPEEVQVDDDTTMYLKKLNNPDNVDDHAALVEAVAIQLIMSVAASSSRNAQSDSRFHWVQPSNAQNVPNAPNVPNPPDVADVARFLIATFPEIATP